MQGDQTHRNKLEIIGQLTASLVHEVRNSLSALKMNLDYLDMMSEELPSDANDSVKLSKEAAERINELVTNLLRFSKKGDYVESISLNDLVFETIKMIKFKAKNKGIEIYSRIEADIPNINITKNKLLQVLVNLITNAIEACNRGQEIEVSTYNLNEKVVCEISDNGIGIKEDNLVKIFDEFYTNKAEGTGLGLHVCKEIIEEFEAEIKCESTYGNGAIFFLIFPPAIEEN